MSTDPRTAFLTLCREIIERLERATRQRWWGVDIRPLLEMLAAKARELGFRHAPVVLEDRLRGEEQEGLYASAGVWLVDHHSVDDERIALHIEICTIPDILRTQAQDVQDAVAALDARLAADAEGESE